MATKKKLDTCKEFYTYEDTIHDDYLTIYPEDSSEFDVGDRVAVFKLIGYGEVVSKGKMEVELD